MGKRDPYRDHPDPELRRFKRKYRKFPGVAEFARLIRDGYARGAWADFIAYELARNAKTHLPEFVEAFHSDKGGDVALYVMMALDIAHIPESVPFLTEVLNEGDPRFTPYAQRALRAIDTPESRKVLWEASITNDDSNSY